MRDVSKKSIFLFILVSLLSIVIPHPPNCSALLPFAYLIGIWCQRLRALFFSIVLSLVANVWYDFFYHYPVDYIWLCFSAFAVMSVTAVGFNKRISLREVYQFSLFYWLITNFYVWVISALYPLTAQGFFTCYFAAIPFLLYSVTANILWLSPLFIKKRRSLMVVDA